MPFNDIGLASGLLCGFLFGYVLENAGFGSPCKLTAQFRMSDWSVFKVMFWRSWSPRQAFSCCAAPAFSPPTRCMSRPHFSVRLRSAVR